MAIRVWIPFSVNTTNVLGTNQHIVRISFWCQQKASTAGLAQNRTQDIRVVTATATISFG